MHPELREKLASFDTCRIMGVSVKRLTRALRKLCVKHHSLGKGTLSARLEAVEAHLELERVLLVDPEVSAPNVPARISELRTLRRTLLDQR